MKIGIVVWSFPTISETFVVNHITGLIDKGHDVTIFSLQKNKTPAKHRIIEKYNLLKKTEYVRIPPSNKMACRIYSIFLVLFYGLRFPRKVFRVLHHLLFINRDEFYQRLFFLFLIVSKPQDIYHFHFGNIGRFGAFLKKASLPIKMVTSFHGYDVNQLPLQKDEGYYKDLFEEGDHFIANTHFTQEQVIKLGCKPSKVTVIPVGLHIDQYPFNKRKLFKGETVCILTVGRLVEKKGYEYSIRAIAQLIKEGFAVHYTIVGGGSLREKLETLVSELEITDHVVFLGELIQHQVIEQYVKSHIFVLASVTALNGDKEGQGLVLQEAQACGLPIVSTYHNGIPEGVIEDESAILIPEKDKDALANAIRTLISKQSSWGEMGLAGRKFVEIKYEMKTLIPKILSLYDKL